LNKAYEYANLVISTGGAGTTLECTRKGLPLIVVENKSLMEGHQAQLISEMERRGHLIWCKHLDNLIDCIKEAKRKQFPSFKPDEPLAHKLILSLLDE
jgi:beta-1,4-N-acetylglucosaminyltransferase